MNSPASPVRALRRDAMENRQALLAAAATTLNRDPAASLEAIATEAGLSRRSVYGHFATRDELVLELLSAGADRVARAMESIDESDSRVAIAVVGERLWSEVKHVRVMAHFAVRGPFHAAVAEGLEPVRAQLTAIVDRGVESGELRQDIPVAVLTRLIEGAALAVLDESLRSEVSDSEGRALVMLAGLSMAGLSWREADQLVQRLETA